MKATFSLLALFGFMFAVVKGDVCVGTPSTLGQGANCGGAVNCAFGFYCDKTSTCSALVAVGGTCDTTYSSSMCVPTATCKGPIGSQTCVANANPGEPCSTSNTDTVAYCMNSQNNLGCVSNVCKNGMIGDACKATSDCYTNLTCTGSVCTGLQNGQFCISTSQCSPTSACVSNVCVATIATGDCTLTPDLCAFGSFCLNNPTANVTTCVPAQTLATGAFCGGAYFSSFLCQSSMRCINTQCTHGRVKQCASGGCSSDEFCNCGGLSLAFGTGQCSKNPCSTQYQNLYQCLNNKCQTTGLTGVSYAKSCLNTNCLQQYTSYEQCAGAAQIGVSFLFVTIVAFLTSYFSKL